MSKSNQLLVAQSKDEICTILNDTVVAICQRALEKRGCFTVALSGGSLVSFLKTIENSFTKAHVHPCWDNWHVILADERCVPLSSQDSNLGALQEQVLGNLPIPPSQIYGLNQNMLNDLPSLAQEYEVVVDKVFDLSGGSLDLAVLGFGPDGHTCSLFPSHPLLQEQTRRVQWINDSPKPPPNRITLTFPALQKCRQVIFCGAGSSKNQILKDCFASLKNESEDPLTYSIVMEEPPPYPCAMVDPVEGCTWIVDADAVAGIL